MLTQREISIMRRGGLTDFEIGIINENLRTRPQEIDVTNEAWQSYFRARLNYIRTSLRQGKSLREIRNKIISFLQHHKGTPWDFLRDAYPVKGHKRSDFQARIRAHTKIREHFGRNYF